MAVTAAATGKNTMCLQREANFGDAVASEQRPFKAMQLVQLQGILERLDVNKNRSTWNLVL